MRPALSFSTHIMNQTMSAPAARESVTLYFREGSSDKVYQVSLESAGEGYHVNFAYGRRGSTLSTGTKTNSPVSFDEAKSIYDRLVRKKMAKGYTPGENGIAYQHTESADRVSGLLPQLLNPIDESELERLIGDNKWCAQEKFDGKRILLQKVGAAIHGINRKGLLVGLPSAVVAAAHIFKGDFVLDGECIGERFHGFDLLTLDGEDLRAAPYHARATALLNLLASGQQRHIHYAHTAWKTAEKNQLLATLRQQNREGIVFKHTEAPYVAGRPNSGGTQLKHKFYATCSAVVAKVNPQRSVELRLLNGAGWVPAGNVTVPPNHRVPRVGDVVEVRYLYAFAESGALFQPVYLGVRGDIAQHDCGVSQLKYKAGEEEA
jgi:bifunctional non-homologous end joining protein LigD